VPYNYFVPLFSPQRLFTILFILLFTVTVSPLQAAHKNGCANTDTFFSAVLTNNKIELSWGSADEKNTSHYIIEKCTGKTNCTELALFFTADAPEQAITVTATSNSTETTENPFHKMYRFKDQATTAKNTTLYYRLKTIDKRGMVSYSGWQAIELNKK
jgi:hypothetical protein